MARRRALMDFLLARPVVIGLAVLGALLSTGASLLQARGFLNERNARLLNYAGYGAMGLSMLLFVLAGLWNR
jgi:hypothetical protein